MLGECWWICKGVGLVGEGVGNGVGVYCEVEGGLMVRVILEG